MRGSPLRLLLLAFVGSASSLTVSSPEADATAQVVAHAAKLAKPDLYKASEAIRAKLSPLLSVAAARFGHLIEPESRRKLQFLPPLPSGGTPQQTLDAARAALCNEQGKSTIKQLVGSLQGVSSLEGAIDTIWPCLCSDLSLADPAYAGLLTLSSDFDGTPGAVSQIQTGIGQILPVIFSSTGGICSQSCRDGGVEFLEWFITNADALGATINLQQLVPWLPSISGGLRGLASKLGDCICDGFSWTGLVALFDGDLANVANAALFVAGGQSLVSLVNPAFEATIANLGKYFNFVLGPSGLCSDTGCRAVGVQILSYTKSVVDAVLEAFQSDIGAPLIIAAARDVDYTLLDGCFCGGTMEWTTILGSYASALELLPFDPTTGTLPTEPTLAQATPLIAGALSSTFSPGFMCSSGSCKTLVSQGLAVVEAVKQTWNVPELTTPLAWSSLEWCPVQETAGSLLKQTFTIGGDLEAFGAPQRAAFKRALVTAINAGSDNAFLKLTTGQVTLAVSSGSVNVEASIAVATPALSTAVTTSLTTMAAADPASLSTTLGVTVEAVLAPTTAPIAVQSGSSGSSSNTAAIAGGVAGGVVAIVAFLLLAFLGMKGMKKGGAEKKEPQFTTAAAVDTKADA